MKKSKSGRMALTLIAGTLLLVAGQMSGQTVLSGDHVIEGDLSIGTTTDKGNLKVTGETGSAAAPAVKVTGDGGVVFDGTLGEGAIPVTGAGVRFMWYPKKAALRAGRAMGDEWNDLNIGIDSVAFGAYSFAQGENSVVINGGYASGQSSVAMSGGYASGQSSVAMSGGYADGYVSTALTGGVAGNNFATGLSGGGAFGVNSIATSGGFAEGENSTAVSGGYTSFTGEFSTAIGVGGALGSYSTSINGGLSLGRYSIAAGEGVVASSYRSFVIGSHNKEMMYENGDDWVEEESLFVVGNGTGRPTDPAEIRYHDAFVIRKNGNFEMNGKITMPRQGDILMGEFGETEP